MCRPRSLLLPLGILVLVAAVPPVSAATTHTWSGPASPCGSTLQGCIDAAAAGDIVEVATNVPINEDLTVAKSLELRGALGFTPVLGDLHYVLLSNPSPLSNRIRFEFFTLTRGFVGAVQTSSGIFDVGIQYVWVQNTFNGIPEVEVRTGSFGPYGPFQVGIVGNRFTIPPNSQNSGTSAIALEGGYASTLTGIIEQNRIEHYDGGQYPAIGIYNVDADLQVSAIKNEIRGADYNDGIMFFQFGKGSSSVRFLGNLVVGQKTESGAPGSYVMVIDDGSADFEIVNNTAANGDYGILVSGRDDLGASWSGIVANNIVADMTGLGIVIDQPDLTSGAVENDHNLTFNVAFNDFTPGPGPGTLSANPLFAGAGNYRLTDPSPARNTGNNARVPPDLTHDLGGNPRIFGGIVDMGAYESLSLVAAEAASDPRLRLHPNQPNPFRAATSIRYELPQADRVWVGVFDVQGRLVRRLVGGAFQQAGPQASRWDGTDLDGKPAAPGVYFLRLEAGSLSASRRIVLLE
jgi:hypothetical protein